MKISIKVKPNARERRVEETGPNQFRVSVKSPARENKANEEVVELLAEHFDLSKSRVSIVSGRKSSQKIVRIEKR